MRNFLPLLVVVVFSSLLLTNVSTQETTRQKPVKEITPHQDRAVKAGIDWLLKHQKRNGLWGCERSGAPCAAVTGLAILSLASTGSTPAKGPYAIPMRRAIEALLRVQGKSGQITLSDSTGIGIFYDHSTATLALSEVYGMMPTREENIHLRRGLERAVRYLYRTQNRRDGGWNAQGDGGSSDLPITCSVWMALRSASNAGLKIESASVEKVEQFVKSCARSRDGFSQHPSIRGGGGMLFYPTSAGLRILYGMGRSDMKEVVAGTRVLLNSKMGQEHGGQISEWDYCAAFYASQALLHEDGPAWSQWYPKLRDHLIKIQNKDGSWTIEYCLCCRAYATTLSILSLQAPKRMLPLFQL